MIPIPIAIDTVLEYYDGIQLFIGLDPFGASYIFLLVFDNEERRERYLGVRISEQRINDLKHNSISLRSIFIQPEEDGCYFFLDNNENNEILAQNIRTGFTPSEDMLPGDGYVCHFPETDDLIIQEQKRLGLPVLTIGVDDVEGTHRIPTDVASNLLLGVSSLYDAVTKKTKTNKTYLIGSSAASLNMHIAVVTGKTNDIFGHIPPQTEEAFKRIGRLLRNEISPKEMETKEYDAIKKIFSAVYDEGLALKYNFKVSVHDQTDNSVYIPAEEVRNHYDTLTESEELISTETEELEGAFISCNIKNGSWTVALTDGKNVSGRQTKDKRALLEGIIISDAIYSLKCKKKTKITPRGNIEINFSIDGIQKRNDVMEGEFFTDHS